MKRFLVVGLGNPGIEFEITRHNAGFLFLDYLNLGNFSSFRDSLINTQIMLDMQVTFMKPMTYMNSSGLAVSEFVNFFDVPIENILVIFDDISLPVGKMRIRAKGSHGGHNGIKSIINCLNSSDFKRIKIGVGDKPENWDLADWVISKFSSDELESLNSVFNNCKKSVDLILQDKILESMNLFN